MPETVPLERLRTTIWSLASPIFALQTPRGHGDGRVIADGAFQGACAANIIADAIGPIGVAGMDRAGFAGASVKRPAPMLEPELEPPCDPEAQP